MASNIYLPINSGISTSYKCFQANFTRLVNAVSPVVADVARKAFQENLISQQNLKAAENLLYLEDSRSSTLLQQILGKIVENPAHFDTFVSILHSVPVLSNLAHELSKSKLALPDSVSQPDTDDSDLECQAIHAQPRHVHSQNKVQPEQLDSAILEQQNKEESKLALQYQLDLHESSCQDMTQIGQGTEANSHLQLTSEVLEQEYQKMVKSTSRHIIKNVPFSELLVFASSLSVTVRRCYKELWENKPSALTKEATNVSQFVEILNTTSNFLNPDLLYAAIEMFPDDETKLLMNAYKEKVQKYLKTTKLEQFVDTCCNWQGVTPKNYVELELEMQSNWRDKTLADISPPIRSWLIKKVFFGSLRVVFSIPSSEELTEEPVQLYLQNHARRVYVNGQCVFNYERSQHTKMIAFQDEYMSSTGQDTEAVTHSLKDEYMSIVSAFTRSLIEDRGRVTQSDLRAHIDRLPREVQKYHQDLITRQHSSVVIEDDISHFVEALETFSNFLNPVLVGDAISEYGDDVIKARMKAYSMKLKVFKETTTLEQFSQTVSWKGATPPGYKEHEVEIKEGSQHTKTLMDLSPPNKSWLLKKAFSRGKIILYSIPKEDEASKEDFHRQNSAIVKRQSTYDFDSSEEILETPTIERTKPEELNIDTVVFLHPYLDNTRNFLIILLSYVITLQLGTSI